jgi:DNA topoisomerase-1
VTQVELLLQRGFRRQGSLKSGFRFRGAPARELDRIHSLGIPPAWTDVAVARNAQSKLQAIGRDAKGRWQYRYSRLAVREREERKYEKLMAFGKAMPRLRATVEHGLRLHGLPRERVMACILHILSTSFMRSGSEIYAKENGSFGISTLLKKHVTVRGDVVRFAYRGKSGKDQERELHDRRVARVVRELMKLKGRELFQFVDDDGQVVNITRQMINDAIKESMGENFSAKDFRTWAGTMIAACALARLHGEAVPGVTDRKKLQVAAIKETAAQLGNTPAVCKSSYIWHSVLRSFQQGEVIDTRKPVEKALLKLLDAGRVKHREVLDRRRKPRSEKLH